MFSKNTYVTRRKKLKELLKTGLVLIPGNKEKLINNFSVYRQDTNFLYYFGHDEQNLWGIIDIDNDKDILFGENRNVDDIVWMGPDELITEKAARVGADFLPTSKICDVVDKATQNGTRIHWIPQYDADTKIFLEELLGVNHKEINKNISRDFVKAVITQRSVKTAEEVEQISQALLISYVMNTFAMKHTKPGLYEKDIYGALEGIALSQGKGVSFPMIFSVRGETLHNPNHENIMKDGDLVLVDSGAESDFHYASDITRTFPVSGKFSSEQKDIYNVVLRSQLAAIEMMQTGVPYLNCHIKTAIVITEGMKELGFMKGDVLDAVNAGAHALFFPHGLGHMLGLDVHDLEPLGEDNVGYNDEFKRSSQFGLANLRMARRLETGFVITVEPGIYFIPQLIANWKKENRHAEFINYGLVEKYIGFGGIRIEDNVLITNEGPLVLGKPIPKSINEIEAECNS